MHRPTPSCPLPSTSSHGLVPLPRHRCRPQYTSRQGHCRCHPLPLALSPPPGQPLQQHLQRRKRDRRPSRIHSSNPSSHSNCHSSHHQSHRHRHSSGQLALARCTSCSPPSSFPAAPYHPVVGFHTPSPSPSHWAHTSLGPHTAHTAHPPAHLPREHPRKRGLTSTSPAQVWAVWVHTRGQVAAPPHPPPPLPTGSFSRAHAARSPASYHPSDPHPTATAAPRKLLQQAGYGVLLEQGARGKVTEACSSAHASWQRRRLYSSRWLRSPRCLRCVDV